jgi:hypothetical protein
MSLALSIFMTMPDSNSNIEEVITDDTVILNYTKSEGVTKCSIKMILENGKWKWERKPFVNNAICTVNLNE